MKIRITTDVRQNQEIFTVKDIWVDAEDLWKIVRYIYENHKTHKLEIINESLVTEGDES